MSAAYIVLIPIWCGVNGLYGVDYGCSDGCELSLRGLC